MSATEVKVFDNGGETMDRYTIVYMSTLERGAYQFQGMSVDPRGYCQWGECAEEWINETEDKLITVSDLPFACQRQVIISLEGL